MTLHDRPTVLVPGTLYDCIQVYAYRVPGTVEEKQYAGALRTITPIITHQTLQRSGACHGNLFRAIRGSKPKLMGTS